MLKLYFFCVFFLLLSQFGWAQNGDLLNGISQRAGSFGGQSGGKQDSISFEHRDDAKDSITISFKYFDSLRAVRLDTMINDFYRYFSEPVAQQYLGNNGAAGYSLIFSPLAKAGWDAGFHAYDVYKFTLENTRLFKTTKPFSQLGYQLASGKEQMIKILHTQNPRPNFNFGFEYRLINAPGTFVTQNTNHNNLRFFGTYQGKRKRYGANLILISNAISGAENGGIRNDSFIASANFSRRFAVPVNLGLTPKTDPNPFVTKVNTGNVYRDFTFFLRQFYDIGKKDSIAINDSTTEYLFYSKLRFQHTFTYNSQSYQFKDLSSDSAIALYKSWYNLTLPTNQFSVTDQWKILSNDFSLLQFPDTKNLNQYILAGVILENLTGTFEQGSQKFNNLQLHGEYRNKTRNKKWDILAKGAFYLSGFNSGDYNAYATLTRLLGTKLGSVRLLFNNVSRTPSFIFNSSSSFNFNNSSLSKKENITTLSASAENKYFTISATNYLIANYAYFTNYYQTEQYGSVINLLQISASKKIKISRHWNWYPEVTLQQTDGAAPIRVPLVFSRNRLAFEGLFYKNLQLSTGIEVKYYTPYKGYNYSPVMGQFVPQDSVVIRNLPDVNIFMHFRIKSFTGYVRAENINSVSFRNGFGFTNNNFAALHYPYPGFIFRFGIQWAFVN